MLCGMQSSLSVFPPTRRNHRLNNVFPNAESPGQSVDCCRAERAPWEEAWPTKSSEPGSAGGRAGAGFAAVGAHPFPGCQPRCQGCKFLLIQRRFCFGVESSQWYLPSISVLGSQLSTQRSQKNSAPSALRALVRNPDSLGARGVLIGPILPEKMDTRRKRASKGTQKGLEWWCKQ